MAGSGDLQVFRLLRFLRSRNSADGHANYGTQIAVSTFCGKLRFLLFHVIQLPCILFLKFGYYNVISGAVIFLKWLAEKHKEVLPHLLL